MAKGAFAILYVHLDDEKGIALDHYFTAGWTIGVIARMARYVADIGVVYPLGTSYLIGKLERSHRRRREMRHLVVGVKTGKMDGHIGSHFFHQPFDQTLEHFFRVVEGGDHQIDYLEMHPAPGDPFDASQYGTKLGTAHVSIELIAEAFQVDLYGAQDSAHLFERRLVHETT